MANAKMNRYSNLGSGQVLGDGNGMAKVYKPKVWICRQILAIGASQIAETFGVVGKIYIDALRSEMIRELEACNQPISSWREIADRVKGREAMIGLN